MFPLGYFESFSMGLWLETRSWSNIIFWSQFGSGTISNTETEDDIDWFTLPVSNTVLQVELSTEFNAFGMTPGLTEAGETSEVTSLLVGTGGVLEGSTTSFRVTYGTLSVGFLMLERAQLGIALSEVVDPTEDPGEWALELRIVEFEQALNRGEYSPLSERFAAEQEIAEIDAEIALLAPEFRSVFEPYFDKVKEIYAKYFVPTYWVNDEEVGFGDFDQLLSVTTGGSGLISFSGDSYENFWTGDLSNPNEFRYYDTTYRFDIDVTVLDLSGLTDPPPFEEGSDIADTYSGSSGADNYAGNAGDDTINTGEGNDTANGGPDNDTINGGPGQDYLIGGSGNDTISGDANDDLLDGGTGADTLLGGEGNDFLIGGSGNDILDGGGGENEIRSGTGADTIITWDGSDTIRGALPELDGDSIEGFFYDDTLVVEGPPLRSEQVLVDAFSLEPTILFDMNLDGEADYRINFDYLPSIAFTLISYNGATEIIFDLPNASRLTDGDDRYISGFDGGDLVDAGGGSDFIAGQLGSDILSGGAGDDVISGGGGIDTLLPGIGRDVLTGGDGADRFAIATTDYEIGAGIVAKIITDFEVGTDRLELSGFDVFAFEDLLFSTAPSGLALDLGNDRFVLFEGLVQADMSADDFVFNAAPRALDVAGAGGVELSVGNDRFIAASSTEDLFVFGGPVGENGNDAIVTGSGDDQVFGEAGSDVLITGAGNDVVSAGLGADRVTLGEGADIYVITFGEVETGFVADFITDFNPAEDLVRWFGSGLSSIDDIAFSTVEAGVAAQLASTHFLVFEGFDTVDDLLSAGAVFDIV